MVLLITVISSMVVGIMTTESMAATQNESPADGVAASGKTAAEQAATAANTIKYGDVNMDGAIDSVDLALLKSYLLAKTSTLPKTEAGDVNGDGTVDALDYAVLQKYLLGTITTLPADENGKILIPHKSWTCGMPDGIPKPENGVLVFEATMKLEHSYDMGKTQYGQRKVFVIQDGNVTGTKIKGSVMSGGLDFQLNLSNGAMEIEQLLVIKTTDGNYIYLRSAGTAINQGDVRMVPDFEAPNSSSYNWLNSGKYAGRRIVDSAAGTMKISVYDVSGITVKPDSTNSLTVTKPGDMPSQPWDYRTASSERNGNKFITEAVNIGSSQSVGASKRGNRNIIPITGGTVTGNITARILPAGADFQNLSTPMTIDARYLWETDDGEIIIVRNGGQFGALVPTFEVRADSKYSYLNQKPYLSSNPAGGAGNVTITFYESTK
ncbi:MAG TPA: DUF3237 family protein [Ruminiclostridium sp.]|nr:DUF3237 family protein [Ruminiclostridium sp.]